MGEIHQRKHSREMETSNDINDLNGFQLGVKDR